MSIRSFTSLATSGLYILLLSACGNDINTTNGTTAKSPLPKVTKNSGMLRISTEPGNAQIFVNGNRKGNSSLDRDQVFTIKLGQGNYVIEALIPSQGPEEQYAKREDVFIADGTMQSLSLDLKSRPSEELRKKYNGRAIEPEMVAIPAGSFTMGSPDNEPQRSSDESPQRQAQIAAFEIGKYEVTFSEWDACVADGGCQHWPEDEGWGRGNRPVINVSFDDITNEYIPWLNRKTGKQYRLPSEAEWEYAARAGTTTRFNTGDCITTAQANFDGSEPAEGCPKGEYRGQTLPVGSFHSNTFGLYDMHGNVLEWVQDCSNEGYHSAPSTGAARTDGDCDSRVFRGGSWSNHGGLVRVAFRNYISHDFRYNPLGFRLSRSR